MNNLTIYFGNKQICFLHENAPLPIVESKFSIISSSNTEKEIKLDFNWFIKQKKCSTLIFHTSNGVLAEKKFLNSFKIIEAAGGFITTKEGALFIYRSKKWDLPKGKLDKGESHAKAAIRECEEECGVTGLLIRKQLPQTFHIYKLKGKYVIKKTFWYVMSTHSGQKLKPQKEEGITQLKWFKKSEVGKPLKNTFPSIKDVLRNVDWI